MYVTDIRDFRVKANDYFATRGRSRSFNSEEGTAKLVLYGTEVFYLGMPTSQREGLSFQYEVSSTTRTQDFFGVRLGSVQNMRPDVERAFEIIDNFARLHLPDKYLEAWEASAAGIPQGTVADSLPVRSIVIDACTELCRRLAGLGGGHSSSRRKGFRRD